MISTYHFIGLQDNQIHFMESDQVLEKRKGIFKTSISKRGCYFLRFR